MAQNRDDPQFFANICRKNVQFVPNVILAGGWNLVLDATLDYCNCKHINNPKAQEEVEEIIAEHSLVDKWRELNPQLQRFTWRRTNPVQQSRLDFFLISENV